MRETDNKLVIALSGASGSIYAKVLFDQLTKINDQYSELAIVASDNAKAIWSHELPDIQFNQHHFKEYQNKDLLFWVKIERLAGLKKFLKELVPAQT